MKSFSPRKLVLCFLLSSQLTFVYAQIYKTVEAEQCKIVCKAGNQAGDNLWASNGKLTPAFWGRDIGDSVSWNYFIPSQMNDFKLAIRYSYDRNQYRGYTGAENTSRILFLAIDNSTTLQFPVPDSSSWDIFTTTDILLPQLSPGSHNFTILSRQIHSTANLDCFTFYQGKPDILSPAFRCNRVAVSTTQRFILRATPGVLFTVSLDSILVQFDRIYDYYKEFMGWEPPIPVTIHVIEDSRWDNPGASSYQNQWGVFFRGSTLCHDEGNWCHEMTHMFYVAHFPWWFDESSVRTLTTFNFMPALFPDISPPRENKYYQQCQREGSYVLRNPGVSYQNVDSIHYAIRVKYGAKVFSTFFHLCARAGEKREIDFTPGHHVTKDQIVHYMSLAAGQDVTPLYHQWKGFAGEQ